MRRCEEYIRAGADILFVEALRTPEDAEKAARTLDVPLLYNFVETGKSPLIPAAELERMGFKVVIFPISALLTVCRVVGDLMRELKERGTTSHLLENMVSLQECFNIVGIDELLARAASYAAEPKPAG
jgi:methylisocitrate lyase